MKYRLFGATNKEDFNSVYFIAPEFVYEFLKKINKENLVYNFSFIFDNFKRRWYFSTERKDFLKNKENYLFKEIVVENEYTDKLCKKFNSQLSRTTNNQFRIFYKLFENEFNPNKKENNIFFKYLMDKIAIELYEKEEKRFEVIYISKQKNSIFRTTVDKSYINENVIPYYEILFNTRYEEEIIEIKNIIYDTIMELVERSEKEKATLFDLNTVRLFSSYYKCENFLKKLEKEKAG